MSRMCGVFRDKTTINENRYNTKSLRTCIATLKKCQMLSQISLQNCQEFKLNYAFFAAFAAASAAASAAAAASASTAHWYWPSAKLTGSYLNILCPILKPKKKKQIFHAVQIKSKMNYFPCKMNYFPCNVRKNNNERLCMSFLLTNYP